MDNPNRVRRDYRLDPDIARWLEKKANDLDRTETWVVEWCIRELAKNELPRKSINER